MKKIIFIVSVLSLFILGTFAVQAKSSDFNNDGVVDFQDFVSFASSYGSSDAKHDLDKSGTVDLSDFTQFSSDFGKKISSLSNHDYRIDGIKPHQSDARLDVYVTLRNTGTRADTVGANVILIDEDRQEIMQSGKTSVRLSQQEVYMHVFSFDKPEVGKYVVLVEADNGRTNGLARRFMTVDVR